MKTLRPILWAVGGLILVAIVAVAIFAATFDPNRYKPELIAQVEARTGRTLRIEGDIGLAFWPKLGAKLGRATLSERSSTAVFAKIEEARVALAIMPLLARRVVVDRIELAGLAVEIVRRRDGSNNFDDLLKPPAKAAPSNTPAPKSESGSPLAIDVSGVTLKDATIGWRDERDGSALRLAEVNLTTGRIAHDAPGRIDLQLRLQAIAPKKSDLAVTGRSGYRIDFEHGAIALDGLELKASGDLPTGAKLDLTLATAKFSVAKTRSESAEVKADVRLTEPARTLAAKITLAPMTATGETLNFPSLALDLDLKQGNLALVGQLRSPLRVHLGDTTAHLAGLSGSFTASGPAIPNRSMQLSVAGNADTNWGKQTASTDLAAKFDATQAKAKLNIADFGKPKIGFDLDVDQLDLDRYRAHRPAAAAPGGAVSAPSKLPAAASPAAGPPAAEAPIDLSGLKSLRADGSVRFGALAVSNIKLQGLRAQIHAADGRIEVSPLAASLYQGALAGSVSIDAHKNSFAIRQQLTNVAVGPLLRDVAKRDLLEGRGTVALDVVTTGTTVSALERGVAGTAALNLRDGAIKGINLAEVVRKARALQSGGLQSLEAVQVEKTDFSSLNARFVIRQGIARNDDLVMESPLLRLTGAGAIDIAGGTMDYTAKTVASLNRRPINIPVRVTGPFAALKYQLDLQSMLTDVVKDEVRQRIEDAVKDRLGDQLKGLFGK